MIVCGILSTMVTFTDTDFSGRKMAESSLERIANPQGFIIVGSVVSEEWVVCVVDGRWWTIRALFPFLKSNSRKEPPFVGIRGELCAVLPRASNDLDLEWSFLEPFPMTH